MTPLLKFSNLRVWQKITLIAVTLAMPIVILAYLLIANLGEQSTFIRKELQGVEYLNALRKVQEYIPQHRGLNNVYLNGDKGVADAISAVRSVVDQSMAEVDAVDARLNASLEGTTEKWQKIRSRWKELSARSLTVSAADAFQAHNELMKDLSDLVNHVGDKSNLILDPINLTYALQDNIVYRIPDLTEELAQLRGKTAGYFGDAKLSNEELVDFQYRKGLIEKARALVALNVDNVKTSGRPEAAPIHTRLNELYMEADRELTAYLAVLDKAINEPNAFKSQSIFDAGMKPISKFIALAEATSPELKTLLELRLRGKNQSFYIALAAILLGAALASFLVYSLAKAVSKQTQQIQNMFAQIGIGNFQARAEVLTGDELGEMAISLNAMLDNTLALVQSREERDVMQGSIMKLLEEVAGVADGDLTKEAEVTADMTGAIADSFNYMITQLRQIIGNVQKTSRQVYRSANEVFSTAQSLATGSENQALQIMKTSEAVDEMAVSIQQVSENSSLSAQVASQALSNARKGNEAVKNTIQGMDRIRDQVQETAKRIKRLGETTQEIGQIIQLIDDIADRTSILALNASIQAAMAGEAGRGFAVVAEEVERLADRSTDATKKISTLVKTIQAETSEAVGAMEKGINEVVEGSRLATQAGQSLVEIEQVSQKLAELIQSISTASKLQARSSESLSKSMNEISEITQTTAQGTKQAATSVTNLAELAESLRQSVAKFRIPQSEVVEEGRRSSPGNTMANIEIASPVAAKGKDPAATRF